METNINEITECFYRANVSFAGVFIEDSRSGRTPINRRTNAFCCGFLVPFHGKFSLELDGVPYEMQPGTIVHAGPDMRVKIDSADPTKPWRFAVVHYWVPPHEGEDYPLAHRHFPIAMNENAKIPDLIHQLFELQSAPGAAAHFRGKLLFTNLLGEFIESAERRLPNTEVILIEQVMEFIRQKHAEPLSIAQIAEHFKMDRRKLAASFERHVGLSPSSYMIECRLLKAKELLHTCDCSIKQIAECVGYMDNLYFSKAFKKKTGCSPSEFRQRSGTTG
ncbi:helix-turn-helix domain-containing protein [Cohnella fermenti]|uniref:helix-turn-helix domain-containing protein n=1 Tax=Cohnella fermenti TaxID=2565925 RepID=UPI001454E1F1|nr:AraC family transcriptional regulator [Cohnella fermenti]